MEAIPELQVLLNSLACADGVFGRVARADTHGIEEHVYQLVLDAQAAWSHYAVRGSQGPTDPSDIADALTAVETAQAVEIMAYLSADDLVFPGRTRRDPVQPRRGAERVARLLGHEARWWTNIELEAAMRAWTPVTRFTYDGVIAGIGQNIAFVLLQVGED